MAKKKVKFNKFEIPDSFLNTLYELTGSESKNKGYVVCYIDEDGNGQIKQKFDSQATEFALTKFLEIFWGIVKIFMELNFKEMRLKVMIMRIMKKMIDKLIDRVNI